MVQVSSNTKKWKARLRVVLQVTARAVLEIIDGKQPPGAEATPDQLLAYNRPNGDLYSLLFLLTGGAAHAITEPFLYHTSTAVLYRAWDGIFTL